MVGRTARLGMHVVKLPCASAAVSCHPMRAPEKLLRYGVNSTCTELRCCFDIIGRPSSYVALMHTAVVCSD